ncbi:methyltransferase [Tenggerimyces flavus]|uniref:Methyltransferase n=1 Tax=Tenggerimyces flavus TaxID=1708749 RepID=A0ABV7YMS8_9ACTN|nr:methyltransferase [Tenggerimyces flavus]MBM7786460.1 hypothetical protein [Tenggerimyces flavus]
MTENAGERLAWLADGYLATQLLYVATELGVADALADKPLNTAELAAAVDADAVVLRRILRGLAAERVLEESPDGRFALTPTGELLRADAQGSLRGYVLARGRLYYEALGGLLRSAKTGGVPFEHVHGSAFFDYLAARPEEMASFQGSMSARLSREARAVVAAYDFTRFRSLVDVGGGRGTLLEAILASAPGLEGTLFDQPEVVKDSKLPSHAGDFFVSVPAGADVYLLSRVLHDWDDDRAVAILRTCRAAMPDSGTLLIVESVLPELAAEQPGAIRMDLHMLLLLHGRERTEAEYAELLARAGLRLTATIPADSVTGLHLLEARA